MSKFKHNEKFQIFLFYKKEVTLIFSLTSIGSMLVLYLQKITPTIPFFFTEQAKALLRFDLSVPSSALGIECFYVNSKCFGYFGITPSLFRLPFVEFFPNQSFTRISLLFALILGFFFSIKFLELIWNLILNLQSEIHKKSDLNLTHFSKVLYLSSVITLTAGSVFIQLTRNDGYWEALAWAGTLTIIGLYFGFRSFYFHSKWNLTLSLIAFLLGANARINVGIISFFFGMLLFLMTISKRTDRLDFHTGKNLVRTLLYALPLFSALGISYLKFKKFGSPLNFNPQFLYEPHWVEVMSKNDGAQFSPKYFLTNVFNYLRFDGLTFHNGGVETLRPELVPFTYFWPLSTGSMKVEPVAGLFGLMPILPFFILCICIIVLQWRDLQKVTFLFNLKRWHVISFLSVCASGLFITLNFVAISNRYLGDFIPLTLMVVVFGSALLNVYIKSDFILTKVVGSILFLLASYGAFISWFLVLSKLNRGII